MSADSEPHPAQPDNLAVETAERLLRTSSEVLLYAANVIRRRPRPRERAEVKRVLSGVLADVETVRQSIKD